METTNKLVMINEEVEELLAVVGLLALTWLGLLEKE